MQKRKANEFGFDGKSEGKESAGDSRAQANEGDHCPMGPAGDQVHGTLSSPQAPKEGGYLCTMASANYCNYTVWLRFDLLVTVRLDSKDLN